MDIRTKTVIAELGAMVVAAVVLTSGVTYAQTTCLVYPSNSTPPTGYGASWDVFDSAKALLVKVNCPTSGNALTMTIGKGDTAQYTWNEAYTYQGGWVRHILSGTQEGGWIPGSGTKSITAPTGISASSPFYFVGYTCTNRGSAGWKCGCANSSCTTGMWQLQAYKGIASSGGTGSEPPREFPAITSCGSTISVTPSSLSSNIADGCRTLTLSAGNYGMLRIDGHSGGVLTLRCVTPGECKFSGGGTGSSNVTNSDGVILDGLAWTSGYLTLLDSKNIRVENSSFRNLVSSGLVVNLGDPEKQVNIQLVNNDVYSDPSRTESTLDDGSKNYTMDYGFRIYNAKSVYIADNTFGGGFNHAISFKEGVGYGVIENNTFNGCGRNCAEIGQEPISSTDSSDCRNITSDEALITDNTFTGSALIGILVKNIKKTTITDNTFGGFGGRKISVYPGFTQSTVGACAVSGDGLPPNREVIQSGNN